LLKKKNSKTENKESLLENYNQEEDALISFNFEDLKPDMSTFLKRTKYFFGMTNPLFFFLPNSNISSALATIKKYKDLTEVAENNTI